LTARKGGEAREAEPETGRTGKVLFAEKKEKRLPYKIWTATCVRRGEAQIRRVYSADTSAHRRCVLSQGIPAVFRVLWGVSRVEGREAIHPQQVCPLSPDNDLFIATNPRKKVTTLYQTDI
jgi:hypothetical protein